MLAMTRKILQWLHDNEAQLKDIDYADGVDHDDVRTLVYRRNDVPEASWEVDRDWWRISSLTDSKPVSHLALRRRHDSEEDSDCLALKKRRMSDT